MKSVQYHLEQLKASCRLKKEEDYQKYTQAILVLKKHPSRKVLEGMLTCLRDVDAGEIQYELVEACEAYDPKTYVSTFVRLAKRLRRVAPNWAGLLFQSILNTPTWCKVLVKELTRADNAAFKTCRAWVNDISQENPKYEAVLHKIDEIKLSK